MKLERDLMKLIDQRLGVYQSSGEVIWYNRLNAGKVKTYYGSYLQLSKKGTPDYIALIRNRQEGITVLFIEAKSDTGKLRKEQRIFQAKYEKVDGIYFMCITDIKDLDYWIDKNAKDFVKDISI
jgi:hypothetical protein